MLKKLLSFISVFTLLYPNFTAVSAYSETRPNNQESPITNKNSADDDTFTIDIDGQNVTVYSEDYDEYTEYYFYLNGERIKAATSYKLDEINAKYGPIEQFISKASTPSFSEFKKAFAIDDTVRESIKIENELINKGAPVVESFLISYLLKALPWWGGPAISLAVNITAELIISNPSDNWVLYNRVDYYNRNCTEYLSGRSFNLKNNGVLSPTLYDWNWSENPQLGIINVACKLESQDYPYPSGGGSD